MGKPKKKIEQDVIASMFLPAALVMVFAQMTGVVSNIIDGVVTSRFLGEAAYSAVSLLSPMVNIILLLASFISIGGQIVCSRKVGTGDREEASAVFSFSVLFGAAVAVLFVLLGLVCPGILFRICGVSLEKRPELYGNMLWYLRGYLAGIPAVILVQVLSPFLVMDNGKKLVTLSAAVLCVSDIAGDLANALLFHGGIMGMGLATSLSLCLQLLILLTHFLKKERYLQFSLKALTTTHLKEITKNGSLSFIKKLATILRDIGTNRINLIIAVSTAAIAAKGMQSDLNMLMFCFSIGIGRTLLTMSSMFYGASDKDGLKRVFAFAMKLCLLYAVIFGPILFLIAPLLTRIYTTDLEVTELSVFSIRCMALGLGLDAVSETFQDFLQGIQNRKMVNFLCFAERLFIPLSMAFILGMAFGSKGIMAAVAVGKLVLLLILFVILCIRCKGIPRKLENYMFLPEDFGGAETDNLTARITTMEDVIRESERAADFCLLHGVDRKSSSLMALFVEEMAGNVVKHGKPRNRNGICVDYRLFAKENMICLSLRDFCGEFDPMKYYELTHGDKADQSHSEPDANTKLGIPMVMSLAKDIRYVYSFNSNSLFINLEV